MQKFSVHNEFTQLKEAIVCKPSNYALTEPINNVEAYYFKKEPPDKERLLEEHEIWTDTLERLGVKLIFLKPVEGLVHQLFTRDVGFAVGEHLFLANMAKKIRKKEVGVLQNWLKKSKIPYKKIDRGFVEGGDVIVHHPYLYVGLSQRTDKAGIENLESHLGSEWKVIAIQLAPEVLHLDCVLAILNPGTMIWCPELILSHKPLLAGTFKNAIEISKKEAFHMAANILTVNPDNLLIGAKQKRLQKELKKVGIKVHPIDWSEIKKLGGLFRCATCPLT